MDQKPILDKKKGLKLVALFKSEDPENQQLAVSIVDACDIVKSFPVLLHIMAAHSDMFYLMCTPLVRSYNFKQYVIIQLLQGKTELIPTSHDLNFIMDLWERYHKLQIVQDDVRIRKELILAYQGEELITSFKPKLNPKANVK